ncbi:oligosaccharide flippase family protein [Chloroflexi bacterium TSY]|nr:oligosaccharide flippase family protein [Chloroflexi bacterium TSY]
MLAKLYRTSLGKKGARNRLLSGGAWAFAGRIGMAASGVVVNGLLARLLTPDEMGAYFLTLTIVLVSAMIGQLGLNGLLVRLIAESIGIQRPERAIKAIRIAFGYGIGASFLIAALIAGGVGEWLALFVFGAPPIVGIIGLAAIWLVLNAIQSLLAESFRGFHDIRLAVIFGGLVRNLSLAFSLTVLWWLTGQTTLYRAILLVIGSSMISNGIAFALLGRKIHQLENGLEIAKANGSRSGSQREKEIGEQGQLVSENQSPIPNSQSFNYLENNPLKANPKNKIYARRC